MLCSIEKTIKRLITDKLIIFVKKRNLN